MLFLLPIRQDGNPDTEVTSLWLKKDILFLLAIFCSCSGLIVSHFCVSLQLLVRYHQVVCGSWSICLFRVNLFCVVGNLVNCMKGTNHVAWTFIEIWLVYHNFWPLAIVYLDCWCRWRFMFDLHGYITHKIIWLWNKSTINIWLDYNHHMRIVTR